MVLNKDFGWINALDFGSKGDGIADDTIALQNAIDFLNERGGGTLILPKGTYVVTSLRLHPNITMLGYNATLFRPDNTPNWTRMIQSTHYKSDVDSEPLVIKGITFDGNIYNQGPYLNWEQEQSSLILVSAVKESKGKLVVLIDNCHFKNSVSDGLHIWINTKAIVTNCTAIDCFRGGLTITGGNADIQVSNFHVSDTQELFTTGIDVEVDAPGYNESYSIRLAIDGMIVQSDFDMGVGENSTVELNNVIMDREGVGGYWFSGRDSTIMVSNSVFVHSYEFTELSGNENSKNYSGVVNLHDAKFSNCQFLVKNSKSNQEEIACFGLNYYQSSSPANVKFVDCEFKSITPLSNFDNTIGFNLDTGVEIDEDKVVTFDSCRISDDFDNSIETFLGGKINIINCEFNAKEVSLYMRGGTYEYGDYRYKLYINGFRTNAPAYARITGNDTNIVEQHNVIIDDDSNSIVSDYGIGGTVFLGSRNIYGLNNPSITDTPGIIGDKYINKNPKKGNILEWICIETDESAAVWEELSAIGMGKHYSNSPILEGEWKIGDIIWNSDPISNPYIGWVCISGGGLSGAPWESGIYYYVGALISDGTYLYRANNYGHTPYNESPPSLPQFLGGKILNTPNVQRWKPNTQYEIHDIVLPPVDNGQFYYCWADGISGPTEPDWGPDELDATFDNNVEWGTRTIIEFENIGNASGFEPFGAIGLTSESIINEVKQYIDSEMESVSKMGKFKWEYNNITDSLDLVVFEDE